MSFEEKYRLSPPQPFALEDLVFHVRLPTSDHLRYQQRVGASLYQSDADGNYTQRALPLDRMMELQHRAFLSECVEKVEPAEGRDSPFVFNPEQFYSDFPGAVRDLFAAAMEEVSRLDEEAQDSVGKSVAESNGGLSGGTESPSMEPLKKAAG